MPKKYPPEFKKDVAAVARRGDLTVPEVAVDFGVSQESVRRWVRQAEVDDGVREGRTSTEQSELVQLRRDKRRLEMENEILRRAAAYFASATLPKRCSRWSVTWPPRVPGAVDLRGVGVHRSGLLQVARRTGQRPRPAGRLSDQRAGRRPW